MTASAPPLARGWPVLGSALDLAADTRGFLTRTYQDLGPVFRVHAGPERLMVLAGAEANVFAARQGAQLFRSKEFWQDNDREMGGVTRSLISVDGEEHRAFRRVERRAYSRSHFEANVRPVLAVAAEDLLPYRPGDTLRVAPWCKATVTEQLARVAVTGTARPYLADILAFVQTGLMVTVTRRWPRAALRTPRYLQAKARVYRMVDDLVAWHRAHPPVDRAPDLVDDVLAAQAAAPDFWSDADVRLAAMGAFIAGLDTAANSLAFVLYRLHRHPDVLEAVRAEVDAAFADGPPRAEALGRMPHLHHAVMETLRLHPIAPAITRTANEAFTFAGHTVPAGSQVLIATSVAHGLDQLYPHAATFDPARFEPGRAEHRQPGAYAPFGVGTHTCLGSGLAEGLIMLNAAAVVRTLDLHLDPAYRLREVARPTPSPDARLTLSVRAVRHHPVTLLA
ncbi:cytochrome P450 [Deinococcus maricopensis]|uniref:Cytochrome P450 n=1 Tax=Deinococcus maricopensis (strain DSM 21211 / LMG 22137 / NRRL B-23946 / LB-34) TaxID=709986 RepID=E8U7B0_DEIML|nr:cytochrome P450 [Deinococcus maricopensis]ADV66949.1 cytochrome P450 [Deinococcus maricopensis DSM 21211]